MGIPLLPAPPAAQTTGRSRPLDLEARVRDLEARAESLERELARLRSVHDHLVDTLVDVLWLGGEASNSAADRLRGHVDWDGESVATGLDPEDLQSAWTMEVLADFLERALRPDAPYQDDSPERAQLVMTVGRRMFDGYRDNVNRCIDACLNAYFSDGETMHDRFEWGLLLDSLTCD